MHLIDSEIFTSEKVDFNKNNIVFASAGSGKTSLVEFIIIKAIVEDSQINLENILITTFTRAAISDIKNRIYKTISILIKELESGNFQLISQRFSFLSCNEKREEYKNKLLKICMVNIPIQIISLESLKSILIKSYLINPRICNFESIKLEPAVGIIKKSIHRIFNSLSSPHMNIMSKAIYSIAGFSQGNVKISAEDIFIKRIDPSDLERAFIESSLSTDITLSEIVSLLVKSLEIYDRAVPGTKSALVQKVADVIKSYIFINLIKSNYIFTNFFIGNLKDSSMFNNIKLLILDEAQDASKYDWRFISIVMKQAKSFKGLTCVGDIKQSLYEWRDADPKQLFNISKNKTDILINDKYHLSNNYRSSKVVNQFVNKVFGQFESLDMFNFKQHITMKESNEEGFVCVKKISLDNDLRHEIANILKEGIIDLNSSNTAILAPDREVLQSIGKILKENGIKYSMASEGPILAAEIVCAVLYYSNVHQSKYSINLIAKELFLIPDNYIENEYILLSIDKHIKLWVSSIKEEGIHSLFNIIMSSSHPLYKCSIGEALSSLNKKDLFNDISNITSLLYEIGFSIDLVFTSSEEKVYSIAESLANKVSKSIKNDKINSCHVANAVQLHTIHSAKGLEFDSVMLLFKDRDLSINNIKKYGYSKLRTSLAKLYVACTRAINNLIIFDINKYNNFISDFYIDDGTAIKKANNYVNSYEDIDEFNLDISLENTIIKVEPPIKRMSYTNISSFMNTHTSEQHVDLDKDDSIAKNNNTQIGITVHTIVKDINDYNNIDQSIDLMLGKSDLNELDRKKSKEILHNIFYSKLLNLFEKEYSFIDILKDKRLKVIKETTFLSRDDREEYIGIIDVLIFNKENKSITILDWKTGELPVDSNENELKEFVKSRYSVQKNIYIENIKKIYINDFNNFYMKFVFPRYTTDKKILTVEI